MLKPVLIGLVVMAVAILMAAAFAVLARAFLTIAAIAFVWTTILLWFHTFAGNNPDRGHGPHR